MAFSNPKQVIAQSGLIEGFVVADFGAGSGHYTIAAAKAVGDRGRVYAIDIQKELIARLKREVSSEGVRNVEVLWGDIETPHGSKLKDEMVDVVILANVLFQIERRGGVIEEAKRVVKPGGKVVVVEWKDSFGGIGPRKEDVLSEAMAKSLFERAGFVFDRSLPNAGMHHYGFIMKKP